MDSVNQLRICKYCKKTFPRQKDVYFCTSKCYKKYINISYNLVLKSIKFYKN